MTFGSFRSVFQPFRVAQEVLQAIQRIPSLRFQPGHPLLVPTQPTSQRPYKHHLTHQRILHFPTRPFLLTCVEVSSCPFRAGLAGTGPSSPTAPLPSLPGSLHTCLSVHPGACQSTQGSLLSTLFQNFPNFAQLTFCIRPQRRCDPQTRCKIRSPSCLSDRLFCFALFPTRFHGNRGKDSNKKKRTRRGFHK